MKKIVISVLALAALAALAVPAFSTSLLTENFSYPDGDLTAVGAPNWTTFSGALPTDIQVISGRAVGNNANAPDDAIGFPAQPVTSPTYSCFNVIVTDPGVAANLQSAYFAFFKDAGTSAFFSRVFVLPIQGGGFTFGISWGSVSATVGPTSWTSTLAYGTQYNIVTKYDPATKTSTMWVNPSTEADPNVTNVGTIAPVSVSTYGLRQGAASTLPPAFYQPAGAIAARWSVDNLGVGTTFNDACGLPVPARSATWGALKSLYR